VKSTVVKPSNGKTDQNKQQASSKKRSPAISLRRLTKRQREKLYRSFVWFFLFVFVVSIVGGLVAISVAKH
jgi:ABC-type Na+ efflux pump permease subunit